MRYLADLITTARNHSFSTRSTSDVGIPDDHFIQYFNDAQDRIQSVLAKVGVYLFETITEIDITANTRTYSLPSRTLAGNRVRMVEFSHDGVSKNYFPLRLLTTLQLSNDETTYPMGYLARNNQIIISPIPRSAGGKLRVTYAERLDDLDIRRGTVSSHTDSGTAITALTLSTSDDDVTALDGGTYLCVNDRDGNTTLRNLRYDSYNDSNGVVTITGSSFTYDTGESITDGSYVTVGENTTTHSKLDPIVERYLIKYVVREIVGIEDSSADVVQLDAMLVAMEGDIVDLYSPVNQDVQTIPITNEFFIP